MKQTNLTSAEWCDLVFDGKNKEFGAYILRKQSARNHNKAALIVLVAAILLFSLPVIFNKIMPPKEMVKVTEVTTLIDLPKEEVKKEEVKQVETPPPPPLKTTIKFTPPVIKKDEEVKEKNEIKTQDDLNQAKAAISIADIKGTDEVNGKDVAELKEVAAQPTEEKPYTVVEQMPDFPGGQEKLMKFIHDNLKYPTVAAENQIEGRVVIRFVVSKTGDITEISVLRGIDPSCDKEAMRVVALMPKWIPGKQNGTNVPVIFTLPVTFKLR